MNATAINTWLVPLAGAQSSSSIDALRAFLSAVQELRSGRPDAVGVHSGGPDTIRAVTTSQWWDAIAIHGTLTNIVGFQEADADATLTINRSDLLPVMMQQKTFADQIQAGKARIEGRAEVLMQLQSILIGFDPMFEIMPGTSR